MKDIPVMVLKLFDLSYKYIHKLAIFSVSTMVNAAEVQSENIPQSCIQRNSSVCRLNLWTSHFLPG